MAAPDIPQLPFDFQFGASGANEIEQDSVEDISSCIEAILLTLIGEREGWPEFGVDPGLFAQVSGDPSALLREITAWEPRGPELLTAAPDVLDELILRVRLVVLDTRNSNG